MVSVQCQPNTKNIGPTLAQYRPAVVHSPVLRPDQHVYMCGHSTLQGTASVHCVRSMQTPVNHPRYTCIVLYSPLYEPELVLKSLFIQTMVVSHFS